MAQLTLQSHPWHGISTGENAPDNIYAFIEILPTDAIKYEIHKPSGHIMLDRPQKYSSVCPTLYGFIPQTYSGRIVAESAKMDLNLDSVVGDGDPIDICVLSEREIYHAGILIKCIPIGVIRMIDKGEIDDKIIAVIEGDQVYGEYRDINDCPKTVLDRIQHYLLTYKDLPGSLKPNAVISSVDGADVAKKIIKLSMQDYIESFPEHHKEYESSVAAVESLGR